MSETSRYREDQIEEINAAANRYEDTHRHAVDHHVFNNELPGGEHRPLAREAPAIR